MDTLENHRDQIADPMGKGFLNSGASEASADRPWGWATGTQAK